MRIRSRVLTAAIAASALALLGTGVAQAAPVTPPTTSQPGVTDQAAPVTPPTTSQPGVTDPAAPAAPATPKPAVNPVAPTAPQAPLPIPGAKTTAPAAPDTAIKGEEKKLDGALEIDAAETAEQSIVVAPQNLSPRQSNPAPFAPVVTVPGPVVEASAGADGGVFGTALAANTRHYGNPDGYVGTIGWRVGGATGTAGITIDVTSPTSANLSAFTGDSNAEHPTVVAAPVDAGPVVAAIADAASRYPQIDRAIAAIQLPALPKLEEGPVGPGAVSFAGFDLTGEASLRA